MYSIDFEFEIFNFELCKTISVKDKKLISSLKFMKRDYKTFSNKYYTSDEKDKKLMFTLVVHKLKMFCKSMSLKLKKWLLY